MPYAIQTLLEFIATMKDKNIRIQRIRHKNTNHCQLHKDPMIRDPTPATGIIHEITRQSRNRLYRAEEVLRAIEGPLDTGEG